MLLQRAKIIVISKQILWKRPILSNFASQLNLSCVKDDIFQKSTDHYGAKSINFTLTWIYQLSEIQARFISQLVLKKQLLCELNIPSLRSDKHMIAPREAKQPYDVSGSFWFMGRDICHVRVLASPSALYLKITLNNQFNYQHRWLVQFADLWEGGLVENVRIISARQLEHICGENIRIYRLYKYSLFYSRYTQTVKVTQGAGNLIIRALEDKA